MMLFRLFSRCSVILLILLAFSGLTSSCSENAVSYEDLHGKWDLLEAKRNGRTTQTLEKVYFEFSKDRKMRTNIFGEENNFDVKYNYPKIETTSSQIGIIDVKNLTEDTLRISSRIGDFRYDFELLKSE